jgi:ribosomal protein L20A (L18A)
MHGGEYADRTAPVRSELLEGISQKSPVPHLFVLDRDQRRPSDVQRLEERLVNRIHVLERRELENYLLVPRALLAALRSKCGTDTNVLQRVDETPVEDVEQLIQGTADSLYNTVLLKRVRAELGNLRGGLLTREAVTRLITEGDVQTLPQTVYEAVRAELESYLNEEHIKQVVEEQKEMLDTEWSNPEQRRNIAPGEEIIDAVFQRFGVRYKKPRDTVRIAEEMQPEEIAPEIHDLVRRAVGLNIRE